MVSSVARIPAVSIKRNPMPSMVISSSMLSRVVPAMFEIMALSSFNKALRRVDFPAFGGPTMVIGMPRLITFPMAKESMSCLRVAVIFSSNSRRDSRSAKATSSSAKSNSNSMRLAKSSNSWRSCLISLLNPPRICCRAIWWLAAFSAAITSATASACAKSILPFKNARRVNSPGCAGRMPCATK